MERMPNRPESSSFASVSTFNTRARPARLVATFAISGATMRQGPHHAAQKSTTTGTDEAEAASKSAAFATSIGSDGKGSAAWHFAHLVARSSDSNRNRLTVWQEGQLSRTPS